MLSRANSTLSNNGNGAPAADASTSAAAAATAAAGAMATSSPGATATAAASSSASALSFASGGPRPRVLLGLSGSVASIKAVELVQSLSAWAEVRVLCTARSLHFFSAHELESRLLVKVYQDEDEWRDAPWKRGDPVLHVEVSEGSDFRDTWRFLRSLARPLAALCGTVFRFCGSSDNRVGVLYCVFFPCSGSFVVGPTCL
jgi:hypothetical protein